MGRCGRPKGSRLGSFESVAVTIRKQIRRLIQPHAMQLSLLDLGIKQLPNYAGDVLTGGDLSGEFGDFVIQEAMVHALHHFALEYLFQVFQVQDHSGSRIGFSGNGDFESVVVSVSMRVIAFAEDAAVLFRREIRIVIEVRGGELDFAREQNHSVGLGASLIWARREELPQLPVLSIRPSPSRAPGKRPKAHPRTGPPRARNK